jgi:D-3-phosphoglycerate dehydrogenase
MKYKVLIPEDITQSGKNYLLEKGYEIKMGRGTNVQDIIEDVVDCDAILARTQPFSKQVIEAGKKLKIIARHGVGYNNVDIDFAAQNGIYVTNAPESNAGSVAEHAILLILAIARHLVKMDSSLRSGDFAIRNRQRGNDLAGKTLAIIGLGRIGKITARKAFYGLDMKIVAYDPYINQDDVEDYIEFIGWEDAFKRADFVSLHLPANEKTRKIVSKKEFELMKRSTFLINVARGEVVDENELIEALKSGTIKGAALDVFDSEPPGKDNPLFKLDNVIVTPHNAALTQECMDRMGLHAAICIDQVLKGEKPSWPVNNPSIKNK